jgi:glucokinase
VAGNRHRPAGSVGVDIGGTRLKAGHVAFDGTISDVVTRPIVSGDDPTLLAQLIEVARDLLGLHPRAAAIGVALPGVVDQGFGSRSLPGKLSYLDGFPLVETMMERLGLPIVCENDAVSATLGEWTFGAGRGLSDFTMLTLGTGVGCGVVMDGTMPALLNRGIGLPHAPLARTGSTCLVCGNAGCPDTRLSGPAVATRARERVETTPGGLLQDLPLDDAHGFASVCLAARQNDALALDILTEYVNDLSELVVAVAHVYGTQTVVLSGGLTLSSDLFITKVQNRARALVWRAAHEAPLTVLAAVEPEMCGVQGIAYLASATGNETLSPLIGP